MPQHVRGGRWNALCRKRLEMFTSLYRVPVTCRYFAGTSGGGGDKIHRRTSHGALQTGTHHSRSVSHYAFFAAISYSVRGWLANGVYASERWIDTVCTAMLNCFIMDQLYARRASLSRTSERIFMTIHSLLCYSLRYFDRQVHKSRCGTICMYPATRVNSAWPPLPG